MKVSENWLREWINPALTTQELADQLTMAGIEVGSLSPVCPHFENVVIGKILSVEAHPNAERLTVCQVDVGEEKPLTIVTNCQVNANQYVVVAKEGAHLPGMHKPNEKLAPADMRGVLSQGMFCSSQELGIENGPKDLWTFQDAEAGKNFWQYLQLDDTLIEVELTPNRGDCSSVLGLARELSVLNNLPLTPVKIVPVPATLSDKLNIQNEAPENCPRYVGRLIKGIKTAQTPIWIQERLRRSDIRSLHPVVDILNYVMLELGQPMHAFDMSKINGDIHIRLAHANEKITLLDGQVAELSDATLVIADDSIPLAVAGIMGGEDSAVTAQTTDVFLESALFTAELIAGKARQLGLHTDSSYRFERGVDPQLQTLAIERATRLIMECCGGEPGPIVESIYRDMLPQKNGVEFRPVRLHKVLGDDINVNVMAEILERLKCVILSKSSKNWEVIPPSFRYDLNEEIDLIEEVARIVGYSNLKTQAPISRLEFNPESQTVVPASRIKTILVDLGYQEAITYSFVDESSQQKLFPGHDALKLINPISSDMNVMRLSMWPGLLNALRYNQNRQQTRVKLFEIGMCFVPREGGLLQENRLGAIICGDAFAEHWNGSKRKVDFYDIKGHFETLLKTIGQPMEGVKYEPTIYPACHPGQCADILWNGEKVGTLGKLHPMVQTDWGLEGEIFLLEVKLTALTSVPLPLFFRPSRFPENRRDIAMIVDEQVNSDALVNQVRKDASELLQEVKVFDVYMGKGIEPGRKSIAIGLILQHPSRTLVDEEVDALVQGVIAGLEKEFNAKLRD